MPRSGAALILALVLLAALLLLGLPFLYTQSSSLAGTRSFADSKVAQIGRDSAANMATAIAAYAETPSLRAALPGSPTAAWTSLAETYAPWAPVAGFAAPINPDTPAGYKAAVVPLDAGPNGDGSIGLLPEGFPLTPTAYNAVPLPSETKQRTYLGAIVTDEAGKLDPNDMGPVVWQKFLAALGITDWDDNEVVPAPYPYDSDTVGQLAQHLASVRFNLPDRRITDLEQLLRANPQSQHPLFRHRLTRAELERMRPYLTLHNPRQGRDGFIDLGTVVARDTIHDTFWLDSVPDPKHPLLGIGSVVASETQYATPPQAHIIGMVNGIAETGESEQVVHGKSLFVPDRVANPFAAVGSAIAIEAPAPLNIHQLAVVVRKTLNNGSAEKPVDDGGTPVDDSVVRTIGQQAGANPPSSLGHFLTVPGATPTYGNLFGLSYTLNLPVNSPAFTVANEQPPLGISSMGIFTIEAAATVTDVLGRQTAQELRRDVIQAVPQEYLLERRWITQGDLHTLIAQRYASQMQAWPTAYERRLGAAGAPIFPDDLDLGVTPPPPITADSGIRPRVLPDIAALAATAPNVEELRNTHVAVDWRVSFGGEKMALDADIFSATTTVATPDAPYKPVAPAAAAVDITPDGYDHQLSADLAYRLHGQTLPVAPASNNVGFLTERRPVDPAIDSHELTSRHLSLWFKPKNDWTGGGVIPICEARIPVANAIPQLGQVAAAAGADDSQNYLGLYYDDSKEMLILALAPPSAEHDVDYSPGGATTYPPDNVTSITSMTIDERSLSSFFIPTDAKPLCPKDPNLLGFSSLGKANRVLHCYCTPKSDTKPHFRQNQWYHLQVALASDRAEGADIILDGVVGQELAHRAVGSTAVLGDHFTLPSAILQTPLPYAVNDASMTLYVADIALTTPMGIPLTQLLPARGFVRIDDEYIRYDSIIGSNLHDCMRGQRQNTFVTGADPLKQYPNIQQHLVGALVVPGGYRLGLDTGRIYRGGCALQQDFASGDPIIGSAHPWEIWGKVDKSQMPVFGPDRRLNTTDDIPIHNVPVPFPPLGGVVMITFKGQTEFRYYTASSGTTLTGVQTIETWPVMPAGSPTSAAPNAITVLSTDAGEPTIELVGMPVTGADPLEAGRYTQSYVGSNAFLLQVQETTGRIEWVKYHFILGADAGIAPTTGFFLNLDGFTYKPDPLTSSRGIGRTDFGAKVGSYVGPLSIFAAGSQVLPVQTELGNHGHWVATGDLVTLLPKVLPGTEKPFQAAIRYAATDAYPQPTLPVNDPLQIDSKNEYFAFSAPLDPVLTGGAWTAPIVAAKYDLLCGTCWSGGDLTPRETPVGVTSAIDEPRGQLPRLDLWADGYLLGDGSSARIFFGSQDSERPSVGAGVSTALTIDDICAGPLAGAPGNIDGHELSTGSPARTNVVTNGIKRFFDASGAEKLNVLPADLGMFAQATTPLFDWAHGKMGLVDIDGEVFAYQQLSDADALMIAGKYNLLPENATNPTDQNQVKNGGLFAKLVGRGLLVVDTGVYTHVIPDGPLVANNQIRRPLLSAKRLPVGPVLQLAEALTAGSWFALQDAIPVGPIQPRTLFAPAALFCDPTGVVAKNEVIQLIGPKFHRDYPVGSPMAQEGKYTTAAWLRGMYNTPVAGSWSGAADPKPIVIGWWPRLPSALPNGALTKEHFRSRSYAWVGFPFSLYGAYFDQTRIAMLPAPYSTMSLAEATEDPNHRFLDGSGNSYFTVQARALAYENIWSGPGVPATPTTPWYPAMDWSQQTGVELSLGFPIGNIFLPVVDAEMCFTEPSTRDARPVDGAEMRITWQYANGPSPKLDDLADATGRCPAITSARLRCLAPVRVLANSRSR